jgi:hypothetical protein
MHKTRKDEIMTQWEQVWKFRTKRFMVTLECVPEDQPDLSWMDDETLAKLAGEYVNVVFCVRILWEGNEVACNYLGNSVYANLRDFRDHIGSKGKWGSYFTDMVRQSIDEARKALSNVPRMRCYDELNSPR